MSVQLLNRIVYKAKLMADQHAARRQAKRQVHDLLFALRLHSTTPRSNLLCVFNLTFIPLVCRVYLFSRALIFAIKIGSQTKALPCPPSSLVSRRRVVGCSGGSRYVEGCWGFLDMKINKICFEGLRF